jgi:hypothetical protein
VPGLQPQALAGKTALEEARLEAKIRDFDAVLFADDANVLIWD